MSKKIEPYKGIAEIYEEIRPSYPEELIQDVISKTEIKTNDRLLEIGAGTGKATVQFAEKGFAIQAIELGEDMAEILKAKCVNYPRVSLEVSSFEEWDFSENEVYDMIYCAQAFHWLDPNTKYKKCHALLKDDGYLVLFWYTTCGDALPETREIEGKVEEIVQRYASSYTPTEAKLERRAHDGVVNADERKAEIEASGLFELAEKIEYAHETRNNASQYIKARKSVPAFASILDGLEEEMIEKMDKEIEEVISQYGGYVGTLFNFSLYIAKKRI